MDKNHAKPQSGSVEVKSDEKPKLWGKLRRSIKSFVFSGMCYNHLLQRNDAEDDQFIYDQIEEKKKDSDYQDSVLLDELKTTLTPHKEKRLRHLRNLREKHDEHREKHAEHIQKIRNSYDKRHGAPDEKLQNIRRANDNLYAKHTEHLTEVREKYDARHPEIKYINSKNSKTSGKGK